MKPDEHHRNTKIPRVFSIGDKLYNNFDKSVTCLIVNKGDAIGL
jgi:hypothetical protein